MLYKRVMANTSAIRQRAAHTTHQLSSPSCSTRAISRGLTPNKNLRVFFFCVEKVIRIDYPHKKQKKKKKKKNYQIKRARGLCRKTGFLHFSNSSFVPSCEWIYFFKVNLKTSYKSLSNAINHYFIFKELMTIPFRHLTGQSIGWRELGSSTPCSAFLERLAWVAPGACWKEWSAWGAKTPRRPPGPHPPSP